MRVVYICNWLILYCQNRFKKNLFPFEFYSLNKILINRKFNNFLLLQCQALFSILILSSKSLFIFLTAFSFYSFANQDQHFEKVKMPINNHHRLSNWVHQHLEMALEQRIIANINGFKQTLSNSDLDTDHWGLPGAVIAAPSVEFDPTRSNPSTGLLGEWQDYRGVWKRDAALTMRMIFRLMSQGPWKERSAHFKMSVIKNYASFSETEQGAHRDRIPIDWGGQGDETMLTEPLREPNFDLSKAKVNAFAQPNLRKWGEPQDDGPPLQMIAFLDALSVLSEVAQEPINKNTIKDIELQINRVLRRNLRFIMQTLPLTLSFERSYFERWEETKAQSHFAVLVEQRYALKSLLDKFLLQSSPKTFYAFFGYSVEEISRLIKNIEQHIKTYHLAQNIVLAHYNIDKDHGLVRSKDSGLDVQVLMASLETNKSIDSVSQHYLAPNNPLMRATFFRLDQAFKEKYRINKDSTDPLTGEKLRGAAWGRYPEDQQHFDGDPWFIATYTKIQFLLWDAIQAEKAQFLEITDLDKNYFSELSDLSLSELEIPKDQKKLRITMTDPRFEKILKGMVEKAKETFFRSMIHAGHEGELSEVFDQNSGYKRGIKNLTWSWVELLKAIRMFHRASNQNILGKYVRFEVPKNACELNLANQ